MILTIDIGNTNTVLGGYEERKLMFVSRIRTDASKTADEYAALIRSMLHLNEMSGKQIEGCVVSSVVPSLQAAIKSAVSKISKAKILVIGPGVKTGLNILIDNPAQLGADLASACVGALKKYKLPCVVVDLGTATKFSVIDKAGNMQGCSIMPGVQISLDALSSRTAQLPQISLEGEIPLIGKNTVDSMRSGIVLGTAGMIDALCDKIEKQLGEETTVVATGGLASFIVPHCQRKIIINDTLLLEGLLEIYYKNEKAI